jgi:hypothetical protein
VTWHRIAATALAALAAGCVTPTRSTLGGDTPADARAALLSPAAAAEVCAGRRGPAGAPPHPFTSDGCSVWPDSRWVACCVEHDVAYWCGGSAQARARADRRLRQCVAARSAGMAPLMWLGVRAGGAPWMPAPWRWGYGWDYPAGYTTD